MKIKKLEKDAAGRYDLAAIPDKINEIIELLNDSFITMDPDTAYGEVGGLISVDLSDVNYISCDRLTPLTNEVTHQLSIHNAIDEQTVSIANKKCPKCGESYYMEGPSSTTCVYYPPVYKDGKNINPDRNSVTTEYTCCNCGNTWKETN